MRFDFLFPEMFESFSESIIGRAQKDIIRINIHNIRDFSNDKHRR